MDFMMNPSQIVLLLALVVAGCNFIDIADCVNLKSFSPFQKMGNDEVHYYRQIVDHFTFLPEGSRTFEQRYFINKHYWGGGEQNSPIFVCIGGNYSIETVLGGKGCGVALENAYKFQALLLFIEHRYYGESIPERTKEEIRASKFDYLTVEQALGDFITVIADLKRKMFAESCPVIVFGGSYAGMLAAWMRLKYPHIAHGALASSAPIFSVDDKMPQWAYDTSVKTPPGPWDWQMCTQRVFPFEPTLNAEMIPLSLDNIKSYAEECQKRYGVKPKPRWLKTQFGGLEIKTALKGFASNIIFSNGLTDAYSSLSVLENITDSVIALTTKEGTHCQDLELSHSDDPSWLQEQRSKEIELIKKWIAEYKEDLESLTTQAKANTASLSLY